MANNMTFDEAKEWFVYDPKTGSLKWKKFRGSAALKGTTPGWLHHTGYMYIQFNGKSYGAHRIVWLLHNKAMPKPPFEIDHIDGDPLNNRISNLRIVSRQQNTKNQKRRSTNNSGFTGVCWDKSRNRWLAYINDNGKRKKLGLHRNIEDAVKARKKAEFTAGYHVNHGRIVCR